MNEKEKHLSHYLILAVIIAFFVFMLIMFQHNTNMQYVVSGCAALFYALWGIIHHAVENRLTRVIALEYILISSFTFLVIVAALSI